ncbi:MAG: DUF58 domain-containing protein [Candidatus Dadabacteria bacterium]|nr:MAG: DUF58 domain-containing protein [Candidatus Dadabacteria bacterium]
MISDKLRTGDPFDLKPYHPSDGMRKILWKIYAKTGELISRHPEKSMTPEGKVALYAIADRSGDPLCSIAYQYLKWVEDMEMEIYALPIGGSKVAHSADGFMHEAISSVWDADTQIKEGMIKGCEAILEKVSEDSPELLVDRILVLISQGVLSSDTAYRNLSLFCEYLDKEGVQPVFVYVSGEESGAHKELLKTQGIKAFFFGGKEPKDDLEYEERFLKYCSDARYEVIIHE